MMPQGAPRLACMDYSNARDSPNTRRVTELDSDKGLTPTANLRPRKRMPWVRVYPAGNSYAHSSRPWTHDPYEEFVVPYVCINCDACVYRSGDKELEDSQCRLWMSPAACDVLNASKGMTRLMYRPSRALGQERNNIV